METPRRSPIERWPGRTGKLAVVTRGNCAASTRPRTRKLSRGVPVTRRARGRAARVSWLTLIVTSAPLRRAIALPSAFCTIVLGGNGARPLSAQATAGSLIRSGGGAGGPGAAGGGGLGR